MISTGLPCLTFPNSLKPQVLAGGIGMYITIGQKVFRLGRGALMFMEGANAHSFEVCEVTQVTSKFVGSISSFDLLHLRIKSKKELIELLSKKANRTIEEAEQITLVSFEMAGGE